MWRTSRCAAVGITLATLACGAADPDETGLAHELGDEPEGVPRCSDDSSERGPEPCVDEFGALLCAVSSGYPGDELALCEPTPDEGMRLRYGPRDYDDPDEVALYLLEPGGEDENCVFTHSPNEELAYISDYRARMRPGSHHLIVTTLETSVPESTAPEPCTNADVVGARWLVGSQDPRIDVAVGGYGGEDSEPEPGDPDFGLAQTIGPRTPLRINMHYTNPTDETILREAWISFQYTEESEVTNLVDMITFFQGSINVEPKSKGTTARGRCVAPTERYVGLLTGHFHQIGTRFSVWHDKPSGESSLVYETYDWAEPGNLFYRDGVRNPAPDPELGMHGGHSGYLFLEAGDSLSFECEYFNFTEDRVTLGSTATDEMCNVFGMYYPTDGNVWDCLCVGEQCSRRSGR